MRFSTELELDAAKAELLVVDRLAAVYSAFSSKLKSAGTLTNSNKDISATTLGEISTILT